MSSSRVIAILLPAFLIPVAAGAQGQITAKTRPQAAQISCPVSELEYGFAQTFPDPWYSTTVSEDSPADWGAGANSHGPYTVVVNGKQMLSCRWYGNASTNYEWIRPLYVVRPYVDMPEASWLCPAKLQAKVLTPLPSPWIGTTYQWSLVEKSVNQTPPPKNVCKYVGQPPLEILYPLQATSQPGMTGLATAPPPKIDQLAQAFLVTKAQLTATPTTRTTSCPTTVRFDAHIAVNGPGTVSYRREINGQTDPLQSLNFPAAGEKVVSFQTQAAQSQQQAAGLTLTTQAQASNIVNGQARVIIQSPGGVSASNVAAYQITCTNVSSAGNLAQAGAAPTTQPTAATLTAPQGARDPAAARTAPARTSTMPARAASASRRIEFRTQRIPVRVRDGRAGWAQFDISGETGRRATGRITLSLSARGAASGITTYQIQSGVLQQSESDYDFIIQGAARTAGETASRRFSSQLKLVPTRSGGVVWNWNAPGGVTHTDSWREQTMAAGDVWVIDGLTCQWSGRDLVCS